MVKPIKRLFVDIEVSPNIVLAWRAGYDLVITHDQIVEERKIICIAWKFEGEKKGSVLRWDKNQDDRTMLQAFIKIANEADEVVWHYGDRCDGPWIRTRCLIHGLEPIPDWKSVDTKKLASGRYNFNCNKLDYLAKILGVGEKIKTGYSLWKDIVLNKDPKALDKMCVYCVGDVDLLEGVYKKLQKQAKPKTHVGVLNGGDKWACPRTGSTRVVKNKTRVSAAGTVTHQMQNLEDGSYYQISSAAYQKYLEWKKKQNSR